MRQIVILCMLGMYSLCFAQNAVNASTTIEEQCNTQEELWKVYSHTKKIWKKNYDTLKHLHDDIVACKNRTNEDLNEQLNACRDSLAVFYFFNNEDASIFHDSTLIKNKMAEGLQGDYQTRYETIQKIAQFLNGVSSVEKSINDCKSILKSMGFVDERLIKQSIKDNKKIKMETFKWIRFVDKIQNADLSFLSTEQKQLYEARKEALYKLYDTYF